MSAGVRIGLPFTPISTSPCRIPAASPAGSGHDLGCRHAFGAVGPEHSVLDLVPPRAQPHVLDAEGNEDHDDGDRKERAPGKPTVGRRRNRRHWSSYDFPTKPLKDKGLIRSSCSTCVQNPENLNGVYSILWIGSWKARTASSAHPRFAWGVGRRGARRRRTDPRPFP